MFVLRRRLLRGRRSHRPRAAAERGRGTAGWRQRPESTPRGAPWDGSGLPALPVPGSRPAPPRLGRAGPAPAPPPPREPRARLLARDAGTPGAFPPAVAAGPGDCLALKLGPGEGAGERGIPESGSWHREGQRTRAPLPDAAFAGILGICYYGPLDSVSSMSWETTEVPTDQTVAQHQTGNNTEVFSVSM
ncbi:uncharacterized protein LOC132683928 [Panthera onca]